MKFKYGPYLTPQEYQVEGFTTTIEELNKLQKYCEQSPQDTIEKTKYLKELVINNSNNCEKRKSKSCHSSPLSSSCTTSLMDGEDIVVNKSERNSMSPPKLENTNELLYSTPSSNMKYTLDNYCQLLESNVKHNSPKRTSKMMKYLRKHHYYYQYCGGLNENTILFLIGLIFVLLYVLVVKYLLSDG
nr:unnamed protein product [Naegleria fowleri]